MTTTSAPLSITHRTIAQEFVALLLHIPLGLLGGVLSYIIGALILRFVSLAASLDVRRFPNFFTDIYSPLYWLGNILFGFFVSRHVRSRSGPWVAVIGLIFISATSSGITGLQVIRPTTRSFLEDFGEISGINTSRQAARRVNA